MSNDFIVRTQASDVLKIKLNGSVIPVGSIHYDTTANWNAKAELIGQKDHIYIYSDYIQKDGKNVPAIKAGDGVTLLINTPFTTVDLSEIETALEDKVDKETGKGLSTNDFTDALKTKLDGIETGAEANVQPDWNQTDTTADDYIKNKPSVTGAEWGSITGTLSNQADLKTALDGKVNTETGKGLSTEDFTTAEKTKLSGIETGAEVNVQANWNEADSTADSFIQNKPTIPTKVSDLQNDSGFITGIDWGDVGGTLSDQTDLINALDSKADNSTVGSIATAVSNHIGNTTVHVTANDKTTWNGKQDALTFDSTPTASSSNPVTSDGIKTALDTKAGASDLTSHTGDNVIHVTAMDKANWNGKITEPSGGTAGQVLKKTASGTEWGDAAGSASDITYDNTTSGLTATNVQGAIDESYSELTTGLSSAVKSVNTEIPDANGNVDITKTNIGLGNVDNTSDLDKPISTATQTALTQKQDVLTFDNVPTASSDNPVKSSGIKSALDTKQNSLTFDSTPTENSTNPVTSGGIYLSQKAQDDKIDTISDLLDAKFADDWATIQTMVQIGYGEKYYPVGTQFTVHHDVYGDMLFDVIGHDHDLPAGKDHSMTLLMHNIIYSTQFDENEGFYYCENGLTAGTYNVTITRQPWFAGDVGKTFQFTLASDVPAGAILWWDGHNVTREGRTVRVFNTRGATSAAQTATMTEGNGGTSLGNIDGTGNCNFFDRTVLGSNDWEESGVRQWLNADTASDWWEPKTKWDRLVSYYSRPGFLYGLDADFKNVLVETTHGNRSNTVYDSHGTNVAYNTAEKIFLLCNEEVNLEQEQGIVCDTVYDYYKDAANADRIKYDITSTGTARYWWLRSPFPSSANYERGVYTSGALNSSSALSGLGVAAACVIA